MLHDTVTMISLAPFLRLLMKALTASRWRKRSMWKELRSPANNQHLNAMVWIWSILQRLSVYGLVTSPWHNW